jgi:hypothetical protein
MLAHPSQSPLSLANKVPHSKQNSSKQSPIELKKSSNKSVYHHNNTYDNSMNTNVIMAME